MKPLLVNTFDIEGGAARAAYRLHKGLQQIGLDSKMLVQVKYSDDYTVFGPENKIDKVFSKIRPHLDLLPLYRYKNRNKTPWSNSLLPNKSLVDKINSFNPDIVHLHWINGGFFPISLIPYIKQPIIWTLHDSWPFTGGCHIPYECKKYENHCGQCPHLQSKSEKDLSYKIWKRKFKSFRNANLTIVTPSRWLADCAKRSSLFKNFRIEVIPNGIDTNKFKSIDKTFARNVLGLSKDKKYILFGAMNSTSDPNKGFQFLQPALQKLATLSNIDDIELIVFGASEPKEKPNLGFKVNYLGRIHDDLTLSIVYSAADVFVAPSIMENLPNTVIESLACGTPCVAFNIGGLKDMIDHKKNGYLAQPYNIEDLSYGILFTILDEERRIKMQKVAREKVKENFNILDISKKYMNLYSNILLYN